jgi:hypothetical protein
MPLIQWIMQNLQQTYPSIVLGGSSVVSIEYKIVMSNGVVIEGVARNLITQKYCSFLICEQGFFCRYQNDCSCSIARSIPPRNAFQNRRQNRNAVLPSITQCGRPDIKSILKQVNNSLANVPYFVGPPDYIFIVR